MDMNGALDVIWSKTYQKGHRDDDDHPNGFSTGSLTPVHHFFQQGLDDQGAADNNDDKGQNKPNEQRNVMHDQQLL